MAQEPNATKTLGEWLGMLAPGSLSSDVAEKAAMCLLDSAGLSVAARDENTAASARQIAAMAGGFGPATIWADGSKTSATDAAFANGVASHAHFQDDTDHDSWSHPGSFVPPAVIALAESESISADRVWLAIAAGYATMTWLGAGEEVSRKLIERGFRTSPTLGTIGAAAACAVALGLNAEQAMFAIGIAANTTGGTLEPVGCGSDEWRIQNGRAAQGAVIAALMARDGVLGASNALEGRCGFLSAYCGTDATPSRWFTPPDLSDQLQVMAKPFATLGDNMFAACAAFKALEHGVEHNDIDAIEVTLWRPYAEYPGTAHTGPFATQVQTQASTVFAVGAMLFFGRLTYDIGEEERENEALLDLVRRVKVVPHDGEYHESDLAITMRSGEILRSNASSVPKTLIRQDSARAIKVFEERMIASGHASGHGAKVASNILELARAKADQDIGMLLNQLIS